LVISRQTPIGCKASLRKPYKYSPEIVSAQVDFPASGAEQRLRNLGVPESHIREVRAGKMPLTLDWPAPATGDGIEKRVINGQKVKAGDELYRIADHSHLWVIADVAEPICPLSRWARTPQ
jgi:HlyD family secretion protein